MSLTKIGSIGINTGIQFAGVTTVSTLNASDNVLSVGGTVNFAGNVSIAGTLTYEDVTNVDSVGLITARNGVVVGSGITLSKDGDIFFTGVSTGNGSGLTALNATQLTSGTVPDARFPATLPAASGANLTNLPAANITGTLPAISGANLTNLTAGNLTGALPAISGANLTGVAAGKFVSDGIGITTATPVGIETTSLARKDLTGPAGNTATGAGSSFHGAYMGDGFLSFNTEFSNPTGYYISTFTNALVAGPMQLGTTLTIDGNFTIV